MLSLAEPFPRVPPKFSSAFPTPPAAWVHSGVEVPTATLDFLIPGPRRELGTLRKGLSHGKLRLSCLQVQTDGVGVG